MIDGDASGANSYIRKPFDCNDFLLQIKTRGNYWIDNNRTP